MSDVAALLVTSIALLAQIILGSSLEQRLKKQRKRLNKTWQEMKTLKDKHNPHDISLHRRGLAAWEVWLDHIQLQRDDDDIAKGQGIGDAYFSFACITFIVVCFAVSLGAFVGYKTARQQWTAQTHGVAVSVGMAITVLCLSVYFLCWWWTLHTAEEKFPAIRSRSKNLRRKYNRLLWQL